MLFLPPFLLLFLLHRPFADALGCMSAVCAAGGPSPSSHAVNRIIRCASDSFCGHFRALRRNDQFVEAVDLSCPEFAVVRAPFDGEISAYRPMGGSRAQEGTKGECVPDQGVRIDGRGQWQGYHALISSVQLFRFGGEVNAGQRIGVARNLECAGTRPKPRGDENFVRMELFREDKPIDPTHHLIDCMCTGQICETNRANALEGLPFKFDSRFNGVRGWEIVCPNVRPEEPNSSGESPEQSDNRQTMSPKIYSPIEGEVIGRVRLSASSNSQSYSGCANEGIFVVGTGKWTDYEVRIYNARFRESLALGKQHIEQGQHIGHRLDCAGEEVAQSVFMEVRFQGIVVDVSEAISAHNCKHKQFSQLSFGRFLFY
ncbi:hypothetical protein niasHS_011130 [Heterodera schachtii]|uniref:Peptidase M23 domain-containing protein n=1 Tax=Heterodera schachtii TaxID=97005 RepID=A0ABD2J6I6_HETSC